MDEPEDLLQLARRMARRSGDTSQLRRSRLRPIDRSREAVKRVVGIGQKAFDQAIRQATEQAVSMSALSGDVLPHPYLLLA
jgi:hypothetical protein